MPRHYVRIVHKPKRSHHKKALSKPRINLATPAIIGPIKITDSANPLAALNFNFAFASSVHDEANKMLNKGLTDGARFGLYFLHEWRMANRFWACV